MIYEIKQGEDLIMDIGIFDSGNTAVDLSDAQEIRARIYIKNTKVAQFADTIIPGYSSLSFSGSTVTLELTREITSTFPVGYMYATILVEKPGVILSEIRKEYKYNVGTCLKGDMKDENVY